MLTTAADVTRNSTKDQVTDGNMTTFPSVTDLKTKKGTTNTTYSNVSDLTGPTSDSTD